MRNRDEAADVAPRIAPTAAMAIARASHSLRECCPTAPAYLVSLTGVRRVR